RASAPRGCGRAQGTSGNGICEPASREARPRSRSSAIRQGCRKATSGSISITSSRMTTTIEVGLRRALEQCALLEKALRDHPGQTLHDQVAGSRILIQNLQQRLAFDIE